MAIKATRQEIQAVNDAWSKICAQQGVKTDVLFSDFISQNLVFEPPTDLPKSSTSTIVNLYVDSVNGNDLNSGAVNFPLKTIQKAIDKIPNVFSNSYRINVSACDVTDTITISNKVSQGPYTITINGTMGEAQFTGTVSSSIKDPDAHTLASAAICNKILYFSPSPGWTKNQWKGKYFSRISGAGFSGETKPIISNGADFIELPPTNMAATTVGKIIEPVTEIKKRISISNTLSLMSYVSITNMKVTQDPIGSNLLSSFSSLTTGSTHYFLTNCTFYCPKTEQVLTMQQVSANNCVFDFPLDTLVFLNQPLLLVSPQKSCSFSSCLFTNMRGFLRADQLSYASFASSTVYNETNEHPDWLTLWSKDAYVILPYKIKNGGHVSSLNKSATNTNQGGCFSFIQETPSDFCSVVFNGGTGWIYNVKMVGGGGINSSYTGYEQQTGSFVLGNGACVLCENIEINDTKNGSGLFIVDNSLFKANGSCSVTGTGNDRFGVCARRGGKMCISPYKTSDVTITGDLGDVSVDNATPTAWAGLPASNSTEFSGIYINQP